MSEVIGWSGLRMSEDTSDLVLVWNDEYNQDAHGLTKELLSLGRPSCSFESFDPKTRLLTYQFGMESNNNLTSNEGAELTHGKSLRYGRVPPAEWGFKKKTSISTEFLPSHKLGPWLFGVYVPDNFLEPVIEEPQLPDTEDDFVEDAPSRIDVLSGKLQMPDCLIEQLTRDLGIRARVPIQYERTEDDRLIVSPRVWKNKQPHSAFTTGRTSRVNVWNLLEDGSYDYAIVYASPSAWFMEIIV